MRLHNIILAAVLITVASAPHVLASCSLDSAPPYPGWEARFNGSVQKGDIVEDGINGTLGMDDLLVEITDILGGGIVNLKVTKRGAYEEFFSAGESQKNFEITLKDLRIKIIDVTTTTANITVFTQDQAILNASANITYATSDLNSSLPDEEIELDIEIKNVGEVKAESITFRENFGDFQIISKDRQLPNSLCANTTYTIEYVLKAPQDLREDTNYTLYLEFTYSGQNSQLQTAKESSRSIPIEISVKPTRLEVKKGSGNFTLLNVGREITISNTVSNPSNTTAFGVSLIDTPPEDFEVVSGQPSLNLDRLFPGDEKKRSYTVISNDPIYCISASKVTYKDELGNSYTSFSDKVLTRFSPFVTITKIFKDNPRYQNLSYDYPIKTRQSMKSDYSNVVPASVEFTADAILKTYDGEIYYSLCPGEFLKGGDEECTDNDAPNIIINRTSEITVKIKNTGNTIARDVNVSETLRDVDYSGAISWSGSLSPGDEASYSYTAAPIGRNLEITTYARYTDIDPLSLVLDIEGYQTGLCTKKVRNVSFDSSPANISYSVSDLHIFQPDIIKVYENSIFDFLPVISNNGTERLYDLEITFDPGIDLTLIQGQKNRKINSLTRGYQSFDSSSCNIDEWSDANITRKISHTQLPELAVAPGESEVIYEIKNGVLKVYVEGSLVPHSSECENDGLKITHDVSIFPRYPYHSPRETGSASAITEEDVEYKIYGNPVQQRYKFFTPEVSEQTTIPITLTATYEDVFGKQYTKTSTTYLIVVPSEAAFAIVRLERTDLGVAINYTNRTEPGEPGQLNIDLTSKGFGPIEKYVLNLSLPKGLELSTNDSNWTGRIEAQFKRTNDTLFVFSGNISRDGNISIRGTKSFLLSIRGSVPGEYLIPYSIVYDGKLLEGALEFKIRGPSLKAAKEVSRTTVDKGDEVNVTISVVNTGDGDARSVIISDGVPSDIPIISGATQLSLEVLKTGESVNLSYTIRADKSADLGTTRVSWLDVTGGSYTGDLEAIKLTVIAPPEETPPSVTVTPAPTQPPLGRVRPKEGAVEEEGIKFDISSREGVGVVALTIVVLVIVFKLMTIRVPAKEEE